MKKRLCLLLVLSALLLSTSAAAETVSQSMANFIAVATYDDSFGDVTTSDWYYQNVEALYELGLTTGNGKGDFGASDSVTVAQALTFAARIHSIYYYGDASTGPDRFKNDADTLWYNQYVRYLYDEGVIKSEFAQQYNNRASRAQVAYILAKVLPSELFDSINDSQVDMALSSRRLMPDITDSTEYRDEIIQLYRWGIVGGSDDLGTFHPKASITRAELAAMLTRLVGVSDRLTLSWTYLDAYSAVGTTYASLVSGQHSFHEAPTTAAEIEDVFWYMIANNMTSVTLNYGKGNLTKDSASQIAQIFLDTLVAHPEQMYNQISTAAALSKGTLQVTFESTNIENASILSGQRQYALDKAIAVHDQLWQEGKLTSDMTQLEKARVYFTWICENCTYDYKLQTRSHTSYSLFAGGLAVCDGYTGAYNLLLRLEDIDCTSITMGEGDAKHMWTVATLDDTTYHIDTTWGDSDDIAPNYLYFGLLPEESMQIHALNIAYSGTQLPS